MKSRNGFVSNSSSSSFIVFFKKLPKTVEETKQILWPKSDDNEVLSFDFHDGNDSISCKAAAAIIFEDISKPKVIAHNEYGKPISTPKAIKELLEQLYYVSLNSYEGVLFPYLKRLPYNLKGIIATDEKLKREYVKLYTKVEELFTDSLEIQNKYITSKIGLAPKYKGKTSLNKDGTRRYTDEEIKEYEKLMDEYYLEREKISKSKDYISLSRKNDKEYNKWQRKADKLRKRMVDNDYKALKKTFKGYKICLFNYGDNTRVGAILEYGNTFKNVDHIVINQH
jgi:hypothetical protein